MEAVDSYWCLDKLPGILKTEAEKYKTKANDYICLYQSIYNLRYMHK